MYLLDHICEMLAFGGVPHCQCEALDQLPFRGILDTLKERGLALSSFCLKIRIMCDFPWTLILT